MIYCCTLFPAKMTTLALIQCGVANGRAAMWSMTTTGFAGKLSCNLRSTSYYTPASGNDHIMKTIYHTQNM